MSVEGEDGPLEVDDRQAVALRTSHESHLVLGLVFAVRTQSVGEVTVDLFGLESVRSVLFCWLFTIKDRVQKYFFYKCTIKFCVRRFV